MKRIRLKIIMVFLVFAFCLSAQTKKRVFVDESSQKKGVIDGTGNIIVPAIYDDIEPSPREIFAGKKDGKMLLFNGDGSIRVPLLYQHIQAHFNNFSNQYGFAAVTKNDKLKNSWGMIRDDGKIIIPEKYQYVRAINEKLLVARTYEEKMLYFFNEKGEILKKIPGNIVEPHDVDNTCFGIEGLDHKTNIYNSDLELITPNDPMSGYWTNGNETILRSDPNKGNYALGMVNQKGKTIIPFEYQSFKHGLDGHWICKKSNSDYTQETAVVYDDKGKVIIPEDNIQVITNQHYYMTFDKTNDFVSLYDKKGKKVLPGKYQYSRAYTRTKNERTLDWSYFYNDYELKNKTTGELYFLQQNGKITSLNGFTQFEYFSEKYPLIATKINDSLGYGRSTLLDFDGKKLLDTTYNSIAYSHDPNMYFVQHDINSKVQILNLPDKKISEEKYLQAIWMLNDFYILQKEKEYFLVNQKMEKIFASTLSIGQPVNIHYITFQKAKALKGKLIAVVSDYKKFPVFTAINEYGDTASIDPRKYENIPVRTPEKKVEEKFSEPFKEIVVTKEMGILEENPKPLEKIKEQDSSVEIQNFAEQMPLFPGGIEAMNEYIGKNLKYPVVAMENGIEGKVIVTCVVEKDGTLTECKVAKGIGGGCDEEALKLVKSFPKFTPGKQKGEPVRVQYTLPVKFKLN
ncbi:MAG: TonB family protein [Saprospiraceae bacterium]|nr:TonB family protein [Saprospiraceae bacterium]